MTFFNAGSPGPRNLDSSQTMPSKEGTSTLLLRLPPPLYKASLMPMYCTINYQFVILFKNSFG